MGYSRRSQEKARSYKRTRGFLRKILDQGWNMYYLISLMVMAGLLFILCLCLIKLSCDFLHASFHEPPAIEETPGGHAGVNRRPPTEPFHESDFRRAWISPADTRARGD